MEWINKLLWGEGVGHSILLLSVVTALGIQLGKLKLFGISLGITMVLFVGIFLGHFGFTVNPSVVHSFREFGLILLVYSVGMQVGPGFFSSFRKGEIALNMLACGIVFLGVTTALIIHYIIGIPIPTMVGILSGAVTNTPGLGADQQAYSDMTGVSGETIALGCAVAYPLGVIGIILSIISICYAFRISFAKETEQLEEKTDMESGGEAVPISLVVKNPAIFGRSVSELSELLERREFVIPRILRNDTNRIEIVAGNTVLNGDGKIFVITAEHGVEAIKTFTGQEIQMDRKQWVPAESQFISRRILVIRSEINGKRLGALQLRRLHGINVTRINRAGLELVATPNLVLQISDRVTVIGSELAVGKVAETLGNSMKRLNESNLVAIFIGIVLGIIVESLPISFLGIPQPVKLGLAGGPSTVTILINQLGYRYKLVTYTTRSSNLLLRGLGIALFLVCVGLSADEGFVDTIANKGGVTRIGYDFIITSLPLLIIGCVGRYFYKLNYFTLMGLIAGSTIDPPALVYSNMMAGNDTPAAEYATVYPLTMSLRMLTVQLMILFFYT